MTGENFLAGAVALTLTGLAVGGLWAFVYGRHRRDELAGLAMLLLAVVLAGVVLVLWSRA